jgi:hypothetical protein
LRDLGGRRKRIDRSDFDLLLIEGFANTQVLVECLVFLGDFCGSEGVFSRKRSLLGRFSGSL